MKEKVRALVLFSGGLDSILAVKVLELQDIEVTGLCFISNFFGCDNAKKTAEANNVNLRIEDISDDILTLVKNPPSGYGKNLNPCIDCHSLMIKKAAEHLSLYPSPSQGEGRGDIYDFIATGEVLGQRPFSQNRVALERVKKISGVDVLRPLSAKLLEETEVEKNGLVKRGKLLDIQGRTREKQFELAKKLGVSQFPSPSGGCLLTDHDFSQRLIIMLANWADCAINDVALLNHGRVFWFNTDNKNKKVLAVVGRNEAENEILGKLARQGDIMIELNKENGPVTLVRNMLLEGIDDCIIKLKIPGQIALKSLEIDNKNSSPDIVEKAAILTGFYATKARGKETEIKILLIK